LLALFDELKKTNSRANIQSGRSLERRRRIQIMSHTHGVDEVPGLPRKEIEKLAHQLWEKANKPQGRDLEFWSEARAEYERKEVLGSVNQVQKGLKEVGLKVAAAWLRAP
jgi:Protein of unknown function (DUF2934)